MPSSEQLACSVPFQAQQAEQPAGTVNDSQTAEMHTRAGVIEKERLCPRGPHPASPAALHLLLTGTDPAGGRRRRTRRGADSRPQASAGEVIGYLREQRITPTCDPAAGTLHAGTGEAATTVILTAS